jgi:hypothetical protein
MSRTLELATSYVQTFVAAHGRHGCLKIKTRSVFERYDIVSCGDLRDAALRLDEAHGHTFGHTAAKSAVGGGDDSGKLLKGLERETGIEPATSSLGSSRSTAELLPLRLHSL